MHGFAESGRKPEKGAQSMAGFQLEGATSWSVRNARLLGSAAGIAYSSPEVCQQWARNHGFSDFAFLSVADTQAFVARNPEILLVAFRGTEPNQAADWLTDAKCRHLPWDHPKGRVHEGFYQSLKSVWPASGAAGSLPKLLADRGNRKVWITGHSLGGALAEVCAAQAFFVAKVPVEGVYTFGQPRVGDSEFATEVNQKLGSRIFHVINDRDIVPRVPLFGMRFRHYGRRVFFTHDGKREEGSSAIESFKGALNLARLAWDLDLVDASVRHEARLLVTSFLSDLFHTGASQEKLDRLLHDLEQAILERSKALLRAGTEKVTDHSMQDSYLPLFAQG